MRHDILLASGSYFDLLQPERSRFTIDDIAHALSNLCRFTGHTKTFYSVAQHSVYVSYLVPLEYALAGLMHDAAEAFVGDVSKPLKMLLPDYQAIERRVEVEVFSRWGLPPSLHPSVKQADLVMLATEKRDLMPGHDDAWPSVAGVRPTVWDVAPVPPTVARRQFLQRFEELFK